MEKDIFEILTECALNERLDSVVIQDEGCQRVQEEIENLTGRLDESGLSEEQLLVVEGILSSYAENCALYGKLAYQQGIKDCAGLLVEMGLIRDGKEEKKRYDGHEKSDRA